MTYAPIRVLIPCDGALVPADLKAQTWDRTQPLTSMGDTKELNLTIESLYGKVFGEINGRAADLIRIATYCYVADLFITRGGSADVNRDHWRRRLTLCIEVNDPAFWSRPDVNRALTAALAFATDDEWTFAFSTAPSFVGLSQLSLELDNHVLLGQPDSVVLFSGGTDSLCAVVDALKAGKHPLVVSHTPANHVAARINDVLDGLRESFAGTWEFPQIAFDIHRSKKSPEGSTQRSRAFLYAALGVATAMQLGLTEVILADNGYVSINPPISGQIVGAIASHGTHPTFLRLVNTLLSQVSDPWPTVTNTLADSTRAEAFIRLNDYGVASLLRRTHSCGKSLRKDGHPHCGYCSQCIDRRFAFLASGLTEYDAGTRYTLDVFTDPLPPGEPRMVALSYVAFAQDTHDLSDEQLIDQQQELFERSLDTLVGMQLKMLRSARLLKRHAREVLNGLKVVIAERSDALAERTLPVDCLLRLYLAEYDRTPSFSVEIRLDDSDEQVVEPMLEINSARGVAYLLWNHPPPEAYSIRKGHHLLQLLLTNRNQAISAMQLRRLVNGITPDEREVDEKETFVDLVDGFHPDDVDHIGTMMTKEQRDQYQLRMTTLDQLRSQAIADRKLHLAATYEQQRADIKQLLRKATGLGGRLRPNASSKSELARKNVSRAIHDVIRQLVDAQPDLANHLLLSLHLGTFCSYQPDPPQRWRSAA